MWYKDGELYCDQAAAADLASQYGTPLYVYSASEFRSRYQALTDAFAAVSPTVCYSIKSCGNVNICKLLAQCGSGFDVVSGGELHRATLAGADPQKVVFAGVAKTDPEIEQALDAGIAMFNVESEPELENLRAVASRKGMTATAALRVNPDVDPHTHRHTTTGKAETKFGVDVATAERLFAACEHDEAVRLCGVHLHIGSPVYSTEPYVQAITRALELIDRMADKGVEISILNIGGGFGMDYTDNQSPAFDDYAAAIIPLLKDSTLKIFMEPGRSIAANAGVLLTTVQYIKITAVKEFAIVDAAMNDLVRPMMYDSFHFMWPASCGAPFEPPGKQEHLDMPGSVAYDVVGGVCETGDCFAKARLLPTMERGDVLAIFGAGAYGFSMASQYNARPRPAEVLVDGDKVQLIRRRETYDDLVAAELNCQ